MDLVTQAVLGAAIGEAGWGRRLGRGAMLAGALCGMLPDADIVSGLAGPWASMVHHRGFTHSIFFAPLVCGPLGYMAWRLSGRREHVRTWAHLVFWAVLTHPLLDVFTTYGTQLLTPLADTRFAIDGVSIIDPLYTFPLIGALIAAARLRRTRPELGARLCALMLCVTTCYLGVGAAQAARAREAMRAELERQDHADIIQVRAMPTFANIWLWRTVARQADGDILVGQHSHLAPGPIALSRVARPETPLIPAVLADERGRIFHWFADNWVGYSIQETPTGDTQLKMIDLRYGGVSDPTRPMWGALATFDKQGALVDVARFQSRGDLDIKHELGALWRKLWHGGSAP
jgi:inner membrane protein